MYNLICPFFPWTVLEKTVFPPFRASASKKTISLEKLRFYLHVEVYYIHVFIIKEYFILSDPPLEEDDIPTGEWLCNECKSQPLEVHINFCRNGFTGGGIIKFMYVQ